MLIPLFIQHHLPESPSFRQISDQILDQVPYRRLVSKQNRLVQLAELGGIEQTKFTLLKPAEPGRSGIFVIGIVVGGLILFLISSLWGAGFVKKATGVPYEILEEDEKAIIDILMEKGKAPQDEVIKRTGYSKYKISRC